MKYRLKDRELQKKLDEISNGDFSRELASNKKRIFAELNFFEADDPLVPQKRRPVPCVSDNARHGRKG